MPNIRQNSFIGGEVSPSVYGRVDQQKYANGLRTCKNWIVQKQGAVSNRGGTQFIGEAKTTGEVRLIDFVVSQDVGYLLELSDRAMRVWLDDAHLENPNWTSRDESSNGTTDPWDTLNSYDRGYVVDYAGGKWVSRVDGNNGNQPDTSPTEWLQSGTPSGTSNGTLEIETPWDEDLLFDLHYAQSADVMTVAHQNVTPTDIKRKKVWAREFSGSVLLRYQVTFVVEDHGLQPETVPPTGINNAAITAGTTTQSYVVTAQADNGDESYVGTLDTTAFPPYAISAVASIPERPYTSVAIGANDIQVGDYVLIEGSSDVINGLHKVIEVLLFTFLVIDVESAPYQPIPAGGTVKKTALRIPLVAEPAASTPITLNWNYTTGGESEARYVIYKYSAGVYGFIGYSNTSTFDDVGYAPDVTSTPPIYEDIYGDPGEKPATLGYYQQRLVFANTRSNPEQVRMSKVGLYTYFAKTVPPAADGAIEFQTAGLQVNEVRSIIGLDNMALLTSGGEWFVAGDQDGVVTPSTLNARQSGYAGANSLQPVMVNTMALYVQSRGKSVRSMSFNIQAGGYKSNDMTIFSDHLIKDNDIVQWAWQQDPNAVVWCVRDDGTMIALTLIPEHEVWAWHRHETDGQILSCATIPREGEDFVYVLVDRNVGGTPTRYIEKMSNRDLSDPYLLTFLDSAIVSDGRNSTSETITATTLSGGWTYTDSINLAASNATEFAVGDVGNAVSMRVDGIEVVFEIITYTDAQNVVARPDKTVPVAMQATALTDYTRMYDVYTGIDHLAEEEVGVLGDGAYLGTFTVTALGELSLGANYGTVVIGKPYSADIETLDLEVLNQETLFDKRVRVNKVHLLTENTAGLAAGPDADNLKEFTERDWPDGYGPTDLKSGKFTLDAQSYWDDGGRVVVRQDKPLPATILSVVIGGKIGD